MSNKTQQHGLTMIEVLVALAIFATTVVLALASLQFQLQRQHKISQQHTAAHLANSIAIDLQLGVEAWPASPTSTTTSQLIPSTLSTSTTNQEKTYASLNWRVVYTPLPSSETINGQALNRLRIDIKSDDDTIISQEAYRLSTSTRLSSSNRPSTSTRTSTTTGQNP